jgi:hypothetical protein
MKKTFALTAVLALGVVACSPAAEEAATEADTTAVAEEAVAVETPAADAMATETPAADAMAAETPAADAAATPAAEAAAAAATPAAE